VADAALMLSVMADDADLVRRSTEIDVSALRIGLVDRWATGDDDTDRSAFDSVSDIARKFARVARVDGTPVTDAVQADEFLVLLSELRTLLDDYLSTRPDCAVRSLRDVVEFNQRNAERELPHFGQDFFEQASAADGMRTIEYVEARKRNVEWANACFTPLWEGFDVLVAPAYAPAWTTDYAKGHAEARGGVVTTPAAILGLPIVTIPCGLVNGLPIGVSFVGPAHSEALLIAVASVVEASLGLAGDASFRPRDIGGTR
jgi:amidase